MAGYIDTRQLIIDTLVGRPTGEEIQPEDHQKFVLQLLDYVRSVELVAGNSTPVGFAVSNTFPIQPDNGQAVYLSKVPTGTSVTFTNFKDKEGNAITITSALNVVKLVTLLWNGEYWSSNIVEVSVITDTSSGYLFKGVITSLTESPADATNPIFYVAALEGTYTNFQNLVCEKGEVAIFKTNDSGVTWVKETTNISSKNFVFKTDNIEDKAITKDKVSDDIVFSISNVLNLSQNGDYYTTLTSALDSSYTNVQNWIKRGGSITFATDAELTKWETYKYIGSTISETDWKTINNWIISPKFVVLTESEYAALEIKDENTYYFVTEDPE